jgi:hypothetical protein
MPSEANLRAPVPNSNPRETAPQLPMQEPARREAPGDNDPSPPTEPDRRGTPNDNDPSQAPTLDLTFDLTEQDKEAGRYVEPRPIAEIEPRTIPERQETARQILTWILCGILGVVVVLFSAKTLHAASMDETKEILGLIYGPVVALVGAATGFYFGNNSKN